jgi:hypothetical protein
MIDPSERKALLDAANRFDIAYSDLRQSTLRILRILDLEAKECGEATVMDQPAPIKKVEPPEPTGVPVLVPGNVDPRPISKIKAKTGYLGDACRECGMFMLVRVGTCIRCDNCMWDSGCG